MQHEDDRGGGGGGGGDSTTSWFDIASPHPCRALELFGLEGVLSAAPFLHSDHLDPSNNVVPPSYLLWPHLVVTETTTTTTETEDENVVVGQGVRPFTWDDDKERSAAAVALDDMWRRAGAGYTDTGSELPRNIADAWADQVRVLRANNKKMATEKPVFLSSRAIATGTGASIHCRDTTAAGALLYLRSAAIGLVHLTRLARDRDNRDDEVQKVLSSTHSSVKGGLEMLSMWKSAIQRREPPPSELREPVYVLLGDLSDIVARLACSGPRVGRSSNSNNNNSSSSSTKQKKREQGVAAGPPPPALQVAQELAQLLNRTANTEGLTDLHPTIYSFMEDLCATFAARGALSVLSERVLDRSAVRTWRHVHDLVHQAEWDKLTEDPDTTSGMTVTGPDAVPGALPVPSPIFSTIKHMGFSSKATNLARIRARTLWVLSVVVGEKRDIEGLIELQRVLDTIETRIRHQ